MKTKAVAYILIYLSVLSKVGVESNFKAIVDVSAGVVVLCACGLIEFTVSEAALYFCSLRAVYQSCLILVITLLKYESVQQPLLHHTHTSQVQTSSNTTCKTDPNIFRDLVLLSSKVLLSF